MRGQSCMRAPLAGWKLLLLLGAEILPSDFVVAGALAEQFSLFNRCWAALCLSLGLAGHRAALTLLVCRVSRAEPNKKLS